MKPTVSRRTINQKGFSIAVALIILTVLIVIGYAGNLALKEQAVSTEPTENKQAAVTETDSWLTYTSPEEGFSIRYPQDWTPTRTEGKAESVTFKGPGNFSLRYDIYDLDAQVAMSKCANCSFKQQADFQAAPNKQLYVIINSSLESLDPEPLNQELSISGWPTYDEQSDQMWPYYYATSNPRKVIRWVGTYSKDDCAPRIYIGCDSALKMRYDDFSTKPEVRTGVEILKTLKY
jgi:hypothetical protein